MSGIEKRLGMLSEMRRKHLVQLRENLLDPEKDRKGVATNSLAGTLRFLAVADYMLRKDILGFQSGLSEAVNLRIQLFVRFDAGEPVSPSYVSMLAYKALFNALAAGERIKATEFSTAIGGRRAVECEYDRPFDIALGYSVKAILESDKTKAALYLDALDTAGSEPENLDFKGYAVVLRAISE